MVGKILLQIDFWSISPFMSLWGATYLHQYPEFAISHWPYHSQWCLEQYFLGTIRHASHTDSRKCVSRMQAKTQHKHVNLPIAFSAQNIWCIHQLLTALSLAQSAWYIPWSIWSYLGPWATSLEESWKDGEATCSSQTQKGLEGKEGCGLFEYKTK